MLPFESVKRSVLVKRPGDTSPKFGANPHERSVSELINYGIINIDKPKGPTSHQVSDYAKKVLGIQKAGHSGTLDPKVTGVLPVALGRGTRIVQGLLIAGKEYVALMHVHKLVPEERIRKVGQEFTGSIRQLPPVKSNVKRQMRTRNIYYLEIIEIDGQDVLFRAGTQAGTYIRKLIHDMGQRLGCGAHMAELRRTKAGPFDESTLVTLQDIADSLHIFREEGNEKYIRKVIQPLENGCSHLPKIWIHDTTVDSLCHGASLKVPGISKLHSGIAKGDLIAIMSLKDEIVALGNARMSSEEIMSEDRGIAASTDKVFMLPGVYPKIEHIK
jgi:H/ACA ribonucleoprotein complex subunit 4